MYLLPNLLDAETGLLGPRRAGFADVNETTGANGEQIPFPIADFRDAKPVAPGGLGLPALDEDFAIDGDGALVVNGEFGGDGALGGGLGELAHGFVENDGDDAAVGKAGAAGVAWTEDEAAASAGLVEVEIKDELHASVVVAAAAEAAVGGIGREME